MRVKYQLHCSCGKKVAVESTQAGQKAHCSCGAALVVPTMQGLRKLEQIAPDQPQTIPPSWGPPVGLALAGLLILGSGAAYSGWTRSWKPRLIDIDETPPQQYWSMWQSLRSGVRLPEYSTNDYLRLTKIYRQYMRVGVGVMILGFVTLIGAAIATVATGVSQRRRIPTRAP